MSLMDPNLDPMLKFSALRELAKLHEEARRSKEKEPRPKKVSFKKYLIIAIRKFGHLLIDVGYWLEHIGYPETPLKY